jgi:hypothetical protein
LPSVSGDKAFLGCFRPVAGCRSCTVDLGKQGKPSFEA